MRPLFTLVLLALLLTGPIREATSAEVVIPRSEQRVLHARSDAREYRIFIAKPDGPPPAAGFPVLYVLDANAVFGTVVEAVRVQSRRTAATGVVPAIVVGIGYPTDGPFDEGRRILDYTTPADPARLPPRPDGRPWPANGGADAFLRFIEDELKPAIERDFPVDRTRQAIFGHSLGGLFVLHTLFTRPDAFHAYAAVSPSIWWNDGVILDEERRFAAAPPADIRVLIAVGEREQAPGSLQLGPRRMVDDARALAERLSARTGVRVTHRTLEGENHASVLLPAINHALRVALAPTP